MNATTDPRQRTRHQRQRKAPDVVFEVNLVDGTEAERLALQQAAVIRNVVQWCRRNGNSAPPDTSVTCLQHETGLHDQAAAVKPMVGTVPILWCSRRGHSPFAG